MAFEYTFVCVLLGKYDSMYMDSMYSTVEHCDSWYPFGLPS